MISCYWEHFKKQERKEKVEQGGQEEREDTFFQTAIEPLDNLSPDCLSKVNALLLATIN